MRTQKTISLFTFVVTVGLVTALLCIQTAAQTPTPSPVPAPRAPQKPVEPVRRQKTVEATTRLSRVIVENKLAAPQVVTILHSLNGLKVFRLLLRSKEQVEAIANLDSAFSIAGEVHTNVIAGLVLDDGHTIAAWLPEAGAEMPPPGTPFPLRTPLPPRTSVEVPTPTAPPAPEGQGIMAMPAINFQGNLLEPADLRIITRDGKRIHGRYIGLDGLTGLSLINLPTGSLPEIVDSKEQTITVGQRLRVIGPQPAPRGEAGARTAMYVRIGETEGVVVSVSRSPSGGIARVKVKSAKFSPANIGSIVLNDAGQTLGIVNAVDGVEATIVPVAMVRLAAKRVIARQASVPRPWLGVSGEPISPASLERILRNGWQADRARALTDKREGILLTSVAPGSPAAQAKLKPGDVILSVNNDFVRNAEEFSMLLDEASPGSPVLFQVARPGKEFSEAFEIALSESPDPFFGVKTFEWRRPKALKPGSLMAQGIETIALKPRVAVRFGSTGGLLVVYVQPSTEAFKGGLRSGDVIESIDGQPVFSGQTVTLNLPKEPGAVSTCVVVRNREKIVLKFQYSANEYQPKP